MTYTRYEYHGTGADQLDPPPPPGPVLVARTHAWVMYDDPADREAFMDWFERIRQFEQDGTDTERLYRAMVNTGDTTRMSAHIEAVASLRKEPRK